jgi:hypothetical protein
LPIKHEDSSTSEPRDIYFHTRITPSLIYKEPWGYFSHSITPLPEDADLPVIEDDRMYYESFEEKKREAEENGWDKPGMVENFAFSRKWTSTLQGVRGAIW